MWQPFQIDAGASLILIFIGDPDIDNISDAIPVLSLGNPYFL